MGIHLGTQQIHDEPVLESPVGPQLRDECKFGQNWLFAKELRHISFSVKDVHIPLGLQLVKLLARRLGPFFQTGVVRESAQIGMQSFGGVGRRIPGVGQRKYPAGNQLVPDTQRSAVSNPLTKMLLRIACLFHICLEEARQQRGIMGEITWIIRKAKNVGAIGPCLLEEAG